MNIRRWLAPVVGMSLALPGVVAWGATGSVAAEPLPEAQAAAIGDDWLNFTDRLIVRRSVKALTVDDLKQFEAIVGTAASGPLLALGDGESLVYDLGEDVSIDEARTRAADLVAAGLAVLAEPDYRVRIASTPPNDPRWSDQWHLQGVTTSGTLNYGIDLTTAWQRTTGSASVVVAVLDTGMTDHPDLNARNIDRSGQSYPYGYDMISVTADARDGDVRDPDPTDEGDWCEAEDQSSWHGTHVAGTIGADTNNGEGVAGVDQQARLLHVRVLGQCGGYTSDVADGIRWAAGLQVGSLPVNEHPAQVINLSLGSSSPCSVTYQNAIDAARATGAIIVAAAGNEDVDVAGVSPANCNGVIAVAATSKDGARAVYSNFGTRVDIAAPGGSGVSGTGYQWVLSTFNTGTTESANPNYAYLAGTSMAAPHVAGVVALMLSVSPSLTRNQIVDLMRATATPLATVDNAKPIGPGVLNAGALFTGSSPTNVVATAGDSATVNLAWTAAPLRGGLLSGYVVTPFIGSTAQTALSVASGATSVTIENLTNGSTHTFVVRSLYSDGVSYDSLPSNAVVPFGLPAAPTAVVLAAGDGRVTVNWTAPVSDGGRAISEYVVSVTPADAQPVVVAATTTSAVVTGLTNGVSYTATVGATNERGTASSAPSAAVVPAGTPVAPADVSAVAGDGYFDVSWTLPANTGGVDLQSVQVAMQPSSGSEVLLPALPGVSTSARVGSGGLTATLDPQLSYRFRVRATNVAGNTSAYSASSEALFPVVDTAAPVLSDVTPGVVASAGGAVQLTGSGLSGVTTVSFANCSGVTQTRTPASTAPGLISVTAPPCNSGDVSVSAINSAGTSSVVTLRYRSVPTITSLSSSTVSALGGSFTVTGTGFVPGEMWVTVGHQVVSGSAVTVGGAGTTLSIALAALTNVSQLGAVGVTVSVLNLADFTVDTAAFSYVKAPNNVTVSAQTPVDYQFAMTLPIQSGATAGTITYAGSGVCSVPNAAVASASISGVGTCTLTATASESDFVLGGSAPFGVTVNPGTQTLAFGVPSRVTLSAGSVTVPLTASRVSPAEGQGGGDIGFEVIGGAGTVCAVVNGDQGPELQLLAVGTCTVRATVSATTNFLAGESGAVPLEVVPVPTITSVTPAFVSSAGGTTVTISGSALFVTEVANPVQLACGGASVSATSVVFGGTTSAVAIMPVCATIGSTSLRVTTSDGSVEFPITVVQAPTIASVTPDWSLPAGGGTVTVAGTGFVGPTTVQVGSGEPVAAAVASATSLTFVAPAGSLGSYDLTVRVAGGVASTTAAQAFAYQDVPSVPATISATPGDGQVTVTWAAAAPNSRSLSGSVLLLATGSAEPPMWDEIATVSATTGQFLVTGLVNGTAYRFGVLGYNEVGRGEPTVSALATPFTQAAAPTDVTTAVQLPGNGIGSGQVAVSWTDGDLGGSAFVQHDVEVSVDGSSWSPATAQLEGTTATVSGLTNGVTYQLRVRAVTVAGPGVWSAGASATPRHVPSAPAIIAVQSKTPTNGLLGTEVLLTWVASVSNGAVVTGYVVEHSDGSGWEPAAATITGTTATVSGLTPGEQISLRVLAVNDAGTSSASNPAAATPHDVPGSPGGITAEAKTPSNGVPGGGLRIAWTAPTVTNGAQVTTYVVVAVTASAGTEAAASCEATAPATLCDLTGLVNGSSYEVSVSAVNSAGVSLPGALDGSAIPRDVPTALSAPTLTVKTDDNEVPGGGLKVDWLAPASNNGDAVVHFEVVVSADGVVVASHVGSGLTHTFTGLTSGVLHSVTVAARNGAGWSPPSNATTATVRDVPAAPSGVTALPVSAGDGQTDGVLRISWSASATNGAAIDRYDVTVSATGRTTKYCDTNGATLTCDIDDLELGVAYAVSVSATNAAGMSVEATATGTPRAVPAAPTAPTVVAKSPGNGVAGGQIVVTWVAPDDKGDAITAYQVTTSTTEGGTYSIPASLTINGTAATISGLTNGVAVFVKVAAINGAGTSSASPAGTAMPRDVTAAPVAPTLEVKTPSNGLVDTELRATWTLPSATNGAEVTAYEVVVSAGGALVTTYTGSELSQTFTGLTVGTEYSVTVAALNVAGWSAASSASTATPRDVPSAPAPPTLLVTAPSNDVPGGGLRVTWTAPAINGAPISQYEVVVNDGTSIVATHYGSSTTHTFTGLTVGLSHSVTVAAFNAAGWSAGSDAASATPVAVPGAPTALAVQAQTPTNGVAATELFLAWTAPVQTGGTAITGYLVERSANNSTWSPATATIVGATATVSGLTTGTLTYLRVSAVNAAGTSSASTAVSATPRDVPGAPTGVAAVGRTPANGLTATQLRVSWTAPTSDGGDPVTSYKAVATKVGAADFFLCTTLAPTTQCDLSGLEAVTQYDVVVVAVNGAGTSSASSPVERTSTRDVPATVAAPDVEAMTSSNGLSSGQLKVTWVAPVSNGATVLSYTATASATGQTTRTCTVGASTLTCTISSLTNGTAYDVVVTAVNAAGTSTLSAATSQTPRTVPGAPTAVTLTVRNTTDQGVWNNVPDNALKVDWTAPVSTGGDAITSYTATATATGQPSLQCTTASTSCVITGLTNSIAYSVTVSATNAAGTGAAGTAAATARPLAAPGAPTGVVAVRGNQRLTVTWTAPTLSARGGANITGYIAQASPGSGACQTTGAASCIITGLTNGTDYTVTVAAVNSAGLGGDSAATAAVAPATLPSAPATVSAVTASSGQLLVSWALANGNGATVTTYSATANPGGITCVVSGDSCVFERLTNGATYTFTVVATNAVGDSVGSAASTGVAPVGLPSAPLRVVALPTSSALTVNWEEPVDTGGSNVTSYTATAISGGNQFTCTTAGLTCTVTGLTNQVLYTVTVTATTQAGTGPASTSVSATPLAPPSPQQFEAARAAATEDALNVADPVAGGSISITIGGFTPNAWVVIGVSSDPTALGAVQANGSGTVSAQVTLPPNVGAGEHTLSVIDPTSGTSVAQPVTVLAPSVPGAPGQPSVVAGSGTGVVDVTFAAPGSDGGATITSYIVTANPGATTCVRLTAGTCTIVGLTPGTAYTFTVRAINSVGESPASTPSASFTPKARPGAPTNVAATADVNVTGKATVSWTAAAANGATVTYVARAVQDPTKSCTTAALTCDITGLPAYVALTFEVVAGNSEGVGPVSAASTVVTLVPSLPASPREAPGVNAGSVASGAVASGSSASVSVGGFDPFEWVSIVVQSTPQVLSTLQANGVGTVTTTVNVPSGLAVGTHYLTVLSDVRIDGTRRGVAQSFSVAASAPSNPGTGGGGGGGGGTGGGGGGGAPVGTTFPAERFAGADRYSTSVEISRANFNPGVAVVYLATGANFADALAAGAAAGGAGPVLLVERTRVPTSTLTELGRLQPRRIVVLGGTAAIAESVVDAVRALATESTTRQGGADRFATAALVSAATFSPNVEVVYVATGANFADALAAGAAARGRGPVLLATRDGIPDATATELIRLRPRRIVVLGGTSAVAQSVQTALAGYTTGSVSRVGGADRYATAADLSRSTFAPGVPVVYVATGTGFADALAAAALGAPVLLARPTCVPASTKAELDRLDAARVVVLGGAAALSDDVRRLDVCR